MATAMPSWQRLANYNNLFDEIALMDDHPLFYLCQFCSVFIVSRLELSFLSLSRPGVMYADPEKNPEERL
jgi:hypothetical protein